MDNPLKILILEDSPDDVNLIENELKKGNITFISAIVRKKNDFKNALKEFKPDVILSDHALPQFNSIDALKLYKEYQEEYNLSAPFILVSGAVSEGFAVQCIKAGADDYILKSSLIRLPTSILGALEKMRMDSERKKFLTKVIANEALMKETERLAQIGSWQADLLTGKIEWSDETYRIYGYVPGEVEITHERFMSHVHPEDRASLENALGKAINNLDSYECEFRIIDTKGAVKYISAKLVIIFSGDHQRVIRMAGFNLDITNQKKYIKAIEDQNKKLKEIAWIQSHKFRAPLARLMGLINLMDGYNSEEMNQAEILKLIANSANELDDLIRNIVRKTEEIKGNEESTCS